MLRHKILIVEDDVAFAKGLIVRLKANSYHPLWVSDGVQAMRVIRLERPDLVLLDLGLPGGSGFTILERLSTLPATIPVVVLTARDTLENKDRALAAGADLFLQKPVPNAALLTALRMVLEFYIGPGAPRTTGPSTRSVPEPPIEGEVSQPLSTLITN